MEFDHDRYLHWLDGVSHHLKQRGGWGDDANPSDSECLAFPLKGFDCDNGSEFLNWHLLRYFHGHKQPIKFTRSRPYHSNDNTHMEQKNGRVCGSCSAMTA